MSDNYQNNQNGPYPGPGQFNQNPGQYGHGQFNQNVGQYGQGQFNQNPGQYGQGQFNQNAGQYGQGQFNQNPGQYGQGQFNQNPGQFGQGQFNQGQFNQNPGQYDRGQFNQYGQPGQTPYQGGNNQQPKKSSAGLIIGIICGAVVLLALVVVGFVAVIKSINGNKETASEEITTEIDVSDNENSNDDDWDIQLESGETKTEEVTETTTEEATEEVTEEQTEEATEAAVEENELDLSDAKSTLGKYENGIYTNQFFGITFTPKASDHVMTEDEIASLNGVSGSMLNMEEGEFEEQLKKNGQVIDMVTSRVSGDSVNVIIQTLDYSLEGIDLKSILELQKEEMISSLEETSSFADVTYEVSTDTFLGEETPCALITAEVQGIGIHEEIIYIVKDKYLMIVSATSMTESGLDDILSQFSKIE